MIFFDLNEFKSQLKATHRLLCLDIGTVRVGYALSDRDKRLASGRDVFNLKKQKFSSKNLSDIIDEEIVHGIVVGYPLQMDGEAGKSCDMVERFIKKYILPLDQPVFMQDERFSTAAVSRYFNQMELTRKKQSTLNDKAAASYILQATLDRLKG